MSVQRGTVFGKLPRSRVVALRAASPLVMESDPNRVEREGKGAKRPVQPLAGGLDEGLLQRPEAEEKAPLESRRRRFQDESLLGSEDGVGKIESATHSADSTSTPTSR